MDESMELSEASFDTTDEETEAFIGQLDELRKKVVETMMLNSEAGVELKITLQDSSKAWIEHRGFLKQSSENCYEAKKPIIPMLRDLYEAASSTDENQNGRTLQEEEKIAAIRSKQEEYREEIVRVSEARARRRKETAAQMELLEKQKAEKQLKKTQHMLTAECGFSSFGIEMETSSTGERVQIRFKKLSTVPGVEAGIVIELGEKESYKVIEYWPNVSGMQDLESKLVNSELDLTGFLIAARHIFREYFRSSDTFAVVFA